MGSRAQLHQILTAIPGVKSVWFQPPPTVEMIYPAIVYRRVNDDTSFADDRPYRITRRYQVQVIDADPDTVIPDEVAKLPMCISDRDYTVNNLNHYNYNLYF